METAGEAQMLGAALNHSALNLANALGAWLGGLVIAAGLGYRAPSVVGAGLAAAGLVPLAASARAAPPRRRAPTPAAAAVDAAGSACPRPDRCNAACNVARRRARAARTSARHPQADFRRSCAAVAVRAAGPRRGKPGLRGHCGDRLRLYSGSDRGHTSERRAR